MITSRGSLFVVVGRLGKSLTTSKLLPIIATGLFEKIYVFRESKGDISLAVSYITSEVKIPFVPQLINRVIQRIYEPIQLIWYSVKLRPDIINGYQIFPKGINSFIAAKLTNRKCIISCIGGVPEIDTYFRCKRFWRALNIHILSRSDAVTTKGKVVTDYIVKLGVANEKVYTFNGAIDTDRFKPIQNAERDIDLLFVGQLIEVKGPDRFISIVDRVKICRQHVSTRMVGTGYMESSIRESIFNLSLDANVLLEGFIEDPERYYTRAKVLVMPSRSEGLATAMLEAMACGCVPVVAEVGCMGEAAIDGFSAFTIEDYNDIEAYVTAIVKLLSDDDLRNTIATRAVNLVCSKYSTIHQADIIKRIVYSNKWHNPDHL